jgi:hypothetical protein
MEDVMNDALESYATVDGHDFGSGEMNIFVLTDRPTETFEQVEAALRSHQRWSELRAAYREDVGETYTVIWPPNANSFSIK